MNVFLAASCLFLFLASTHATSLEEVSSLVSQVVQENLPVHVQRTISGHGVQLRRYKREVLTKTLDDPENCLRHCSQNYTATLVSATMKHAAKVVAASFEDITGEEFASKENMEAFKKKVEERLMGYMKPLFDQLCRAINTLDACEKACPKSELRDIYVLGHMQPEALCEHQNKQWNNFEEYFQAMNCSNETTEGENPCDGKCGPAVSIANVTNYSLEENELVGADLNYETDREKNTKAVGPVCKSVMCRLDCFKPILTERCGAKAYDTYSRAERIGPRVTLRVLRKLNAVDKNIDCKSFQ